jgi:hypothetical protein
MGSSYSSIRISNFDTNIRIDNNKTFQIPYRNLIDHVVLLRQVIAHPEMMRQGELLNSFIEDYCRRMSQQTMTTKYQQRRLPWQIEWIWHVHRLHPVAYNNDCTKQLPSRRLVDKKYIRLRMKEEHRKYHSPVPSGSIKSHSTFVPSLDLASAVLRQRDFLEKFKQHSLFTMNSVTMTRPIFEDMVQKYLSFLKLAKQNELIVPTFEIDLIWHTHMRFPSNYQIVSTALCGYLLDHNDSIEKRILDDAYRKTADRWKTTYGVDYGKTIDKDKLKTSEYVSSCAMIVTPGAFYSSRTDGGGCGGVAGCGGGGCGGGGCGGCGGG